MQARVQAVVEEILTLPQEVVEQAIALVREARAYPADDATVQTIPTGALADRASQIAAKVMTLVREVRAYPADDATVQTIPTGALADRASQIAAKVMTLLVTTPYPPQDVAAKLLFLVQDLAILPPEIAREAVILGGEMALPDRAVLAAFDWLAARDYAVFGVELWQQAGHMPRWIASSDYEPKQCHAISKRSEYVACCAAGARQFVEQFSNLDEALFNYSWGMEEECILQSVGGAH